MVGQSERDPIITPTTGAAAGLVAEFTANFAAGFAVACAPRGFAPDFVEAAKSKLHPSRGRLTPKERGAAKFKRLKRGGARPSDGGASVSRLAHLCDVTGCLRGHQETLHEAISTQVFSILNAAFAERKRRNDEA